MLQSGSPRHITQLASRVVYEIGLPGIRYAQDLENWALFEPFRIRDTASKPIANDHPALRTAAGILV